MTETMSSTKGKGPVKEPKKDRHMRLVHDLSKFLEQTNEVTIQEVLLLNRNARETLEELDEDLQKFCARIDVDSFLLDKSEDDLIDLLNILKGKILNREKSISTLADDLDNTEMKRSTVVSSELKSLVDKLIAIAYQLPDDIERFVENEAFEVNKDIISNRMTHAKSVANLRINHVKLEHELIEKWEKTRMKWRQLRHDQALGIFENQITSPEYNDPEDRKQYMNNFRNQQMSRFREIESSIGALQHLNYHNINTESVVQIQNNFNACIESEENAIQACYTGLTSLRQNTDYLAKERVEKLRKELHVYGALKICPKLHLCGHELEVFVNDASLSELYRLGGGLKPDLLTLISELTCEEIVYDRVIVSMIEKLEVIIAGFPLKSILESKGRLVQLEKTRTVITKMRNSPRAEIPQVLKSLIPELEEIAHMENIPELFTTSVDGIVMEIKEELTTLEAKIASTASANRTLKPQTGLATLGATGSMTASATTAGNKTAGLTSKTSMATTKSGTRKGTEIVGATSVAMPFIDPLLLKQWHRKLAILFYTSDFSAEYQHLCTTILEKVKIQQQCNTLVDEVIAKVSDDQVRRMDIGYEKVIRHIINFLEGQAHLMQVQTSNLIEFYLNLTKTIEAHRKEQLVIDQKSYDEFFDLSDEFNADLEALEKSYQDSCQLIRQSIKQDEINHHFQDVLTILDKIQELYRKYHKNACFTADRYPLYLIHEYLTLQLTCSQFFFMLPEETHPLINDYNRIFDVVERLNSSYFEENPNIVGFLRRTVQSIFENQQLAESEEGGRVIYVSTLGVAESSSIGGYGGQYAMKFILSDIFKKYSVENAFKNEKSREEEAPAVEIEESTSTKAKLSNLFTPHEKCPWMKAESKVLPISQEEYENMHPDDLEFYELSLMKGFLPLEEPSDPNILNPPPNDKAALAAAAAAPKVGIIALSVEDRQRYFDTKALVAKIKDRVELESSPDFIREHIPLNKQEQPWILKLEVTDSHLKSVFSKFRDNVISSLEVESFKKVLSIENQMGKRKTELTDELEDRIRNHWPRRGRVETEIKQPREAELLGHKEKTWRLIQNVQKKMIDLQEEYLLQMKQSKKACDLYIQELTQLRNSLSTDFKNLAALQGIDVRARGLTIEFQTDCQQRIVVLQKLTNQDTQLVIQYAKDFRKICPPQVLGGDDNGGYSEAELNEIEGLMNGQCDEIQEIIKEWNEQIIQLQEQQDQSFKCIEEFQAKYNKCTQEVAMAEGLGQKYGAPRRRAQEKLRTMISYDEKLAGRIDEYIAQVDFIASEIQFSGASVSIDTGTTTAHSMLTTNSSSSKSVIKTSPMKSIVMELSGLDSFKKLQLLWLLMKTLKTTLKQRVDFLTIQGNIGAPKSLDPLPWIDQVSISDIILLNNSKQSFTDEEIQQQKESLQSLFIDKLPIVEDDIPGMEYIQQMASGTIEAAFQQISKECRQETKDLYQQEGLLSSLNASGVPDSLEQWLHETQDKVLGRHGYREKAWKKVWSQLERLDSLLIRYRNLSAIHKDGEDEDDEGEGLNVSAKMSKKLTTTTQNKTKLASMTLQESTEAVVTISTPVNRALSVQNACLYYYTTTCLFYAKEHYDNHVKFFQSLLLVWEKGREKHERLLKPKLGSPDKVDELNELNTMENQRSQDLIVNVKQFRTLLIRKQIEKFRVYLVNLNQMYKGVMWAMDSTYRQELLQVPPDTEVPKKHLTLKKLRKLQRIKEEISKGGVDQSTVRKWPSIQLKEVVDCVKSFEDLIEDLGKHPDDLTGGLGPAVEAAPAAAAAAPAPAGKKAPPPKKGNDKAAAPAAAPVSSIPSLLPSSWVDKVTEDSIVEANVSSAQRVLVEERTESLLKYFHYLQETLKDIRDDYTLIIKQEESWNERWKRQVDMLRNGTV